MPAQVDSQTNANRSKKQQEAGDLIVGYLKQIGVEYVFGIPGGAIEPLYNALARSEQQGGPRPIVARHETGAAFMADGYARETGKLGVCCSTTGPGATNLITGVASAYENHIPLLVLTAQTALNTFGKGAFQESSDNGIDTVAIFKHCTYYNSLVSHIDQLEYKLTAAIRTALIESVGPVHLSLPPDLLKKEAPRTASFDISAQLQEPSIYDVAAVDTLYEKLASSHHIVLVIGGGCADAIGTILEFSMVFQTPIVATPHGKGLISAHHPLFRGVIGFAGHQTAYQVLRDKSVDLIIAVGTSLSTLR